MDLIQVVVEIRKEKNMNMNDTLKISCLSLEGIVARKVTVKIKPVISI